MKVIERLAERRRFGVRPGLGSIQAVCAALGNPQERVRAIHVAGTNGKGAVCAMLDAAFGAAGKRVGCYTSPHLVKLNERFRIGGVPMDDGRLERAAEKVGAVIESAGVEDVTFFEALTAVAFEVFAHEAVEIAVMECGLGGRLDATNICRPEICVITKIGLDHCDWLGDTVEKIAAEKAGIIKPGVPVVLGRNEAAVREVVAARAAEVGSPFYYAPELAADNEIPNDFALAGSFNRENARTAIAALKVLVGEAELRPYLAGFSRVVWPGRFQQIGKVLVDGAHNPPAARALVEALRERGSKSGELRLIAGFCGDKDVDETLRILAPMVRGGIAVRTNNPRSLAADELAEKMRAAGIEAVACGSLVEALELARDDETLVCGSLFLAGESVVALGGYPWGGVRFDMAESMRRE